MPARAAEEETRSLLEKATSCLFALALTWRLGWWRGAGLAVAPRARSWLPILPLAVIPALMLTFSEFRSGDGRPAASSWPPSP
ncbi:MAG: hypothetical protein IPM94_10515 [bacterium]|nr:hypothetical protein [bacterium]